MPLTMRTGSRRRAGAVAALLLAASAAWVFRAPLFENNLHVVIPGEVYRSAQPSPDELRRLVATLRLRSVVSLRGGKPSNEWFAAQQRALEGLDVELYSLRFSAHRWPGRTQLEQLTHILDTAPRPLLLHCYRGVDRSGLASAVAQLLAGRAPERALGEYDLRHAFVELFARDQFRGVVLRYADWLAERGSSHTADRFRGWVRSDYVADFYSARLEFVARPERMFVGEPAQVSVRVTNTSPGAWTMRSERDRGVRLGARLEARGAGGGVHAELRSGFVDRVVRPGEALVLAVELPAVEAPGRFDLTLDMVDESVTWFEWMGSEPLRAQIEVHGQSSSNTDTASSAKTSRAFGEARASGL